jgi:preprotein translocase subunit SecF
MELFKPGKTYDFMRQRRFWIVLSFFLTISSVILTFTPGPNYGTDFRGGTEIEVDFKQHVDDDELRKAIDTSGKFSEPDIVKAIDATHQNRYLIRVQEITTVGDALKHDLARALCYAEDPSTLDAAKCPVNRRATEVKISPGGDKISTRYDEAPDLEAIKAQIAGVSGVKLRASARNPQVLSERDHRVEIQLQSKGDQLLDEIRVKLGKEKVPDEALRVEWVGGRAGKQLRDSARNAVAIAIVFIMLYLAFRFDLRFAPGVIVACVHDAMVVLGVFVLLHKEVTLATLAAILTVVGYSMNDTIVVYDRIRENLSRYRGKSFAEIINLSVSETLSRTILTSGATMLSVLAFFIWGTGVIKDFALAMVIGILAGTYSSIYVAAPLTEWIDAQLRKRQAAAKAA